MAKRRMQYPVALAAIALGVTVLDHGMRAGAEEACRSTEVAWTSPSVGIYMTADHNPTWATGVFVPAPAPGESARVVASTWSSYDRYLDGTVPTREDDHQLHESWGLSVGGVPYGGLTSDVPDLVSEGAPSPWFSGVIGGSFANEPVGGGEIVLRHASLSGFTESGNSVHPYHVALTVEYCPIADEPTTTMATEITSPTTAETSTIVDATTTTDPPSSSEAASVSTSAPTTEPPPTAPAATVPVVPTTAADPTLPPVPVPGLPSATTTPSTLPASTTVPLVPAGPSLPTTTTVPDRRLPETGAQVGGLLELGGALVLAGTALGLLRRRIAVR